MLLANAALLCDQPQTSAEHKVQRGAAAAALAQDQDYEPVPASVTALHSGRREGAGERGRSHVKILTEHSLQLSLGDVQPASPYGKHGWILVQAKSFRQASSAPRTHTHRPQLSHLQCRGTKQNPAARVHKAGGTLRGRGMAVSTARRATKHHQLTELRRAERCSTRDAAAALSRGSPARPRPHGLEQPLLAAPSPSLRVHDVVSIGTN